MTSSQMARCPQCSGRPSFFGIAAACAKRPRPWIRFDWCEGCRVWLASDESGTVQEVVTKEPPVGPGCGTC